MKNTTSSEHVHVVEYTDPLCVWSWGSEPTLRALRLWYEGRSTWRRVFGVQVPAPQPGEGASLEQPDQVRERWIGVAEHTGAPVPRKLASAVRTTTLASAAAIAAARQGSEQGERVLRRLRESAFVDGRPADTHERIAEVVMTGVVGLDPAMLMRDLVSGAVTDALEHDYEETRRPDAAVIGLNERGAHSGAAKQDGDRWRYAFPTLIVSGPRGRRVLPGWRTLPEYVAAVVSVAPALAGDPPALLRADDALERYRSLTAPELVMLTGATDLPSGARTLETATVPVHFHSDEWRTRRFRSHA
jgi:predicted DsbA family dithiol-disulfide isomerase